MTNESNNINNGENNSDDEPTIIKTMSSSSIPLYSVRKSSFPPLILIPTSVHKVEYRGRWKSKKTSY